MTRATFYLEVVEVTSVRDLRQLKGLELLQVQVELIVKLESSVLVHLGLDLQALHQLKAGILSVIDGLEAKASLS